MKVTSFTENMLSACNAAAVGLHFEEGGCWGMALALYDAFKRLGLAPELVVMPSQGHALVRIGAELFDYSGETMAPAALKAVSVAGLFAEAERAGWSRDEVLTDKETAAEIIHNAATLDWSKWDEDRNRWLTESSVDGVCKTPGAQFHITIKDNELGGIVELPPEVRLDINEKDAVYVEDMIHDALEAVVAKLIAELDEEAEEHWRKAAENDSQ